MFTSGQAWPDLPSARALHPGTMLLSWTLSLITFLPIPACTANLCAVQDGPSDTSNQYKSSVLESLHCHNDYKSYISCSWTVKTQMQALLSLYHWDSTENKESPCVQYRRPDQLPDGRVTVHCQYNTSLFAVGMQHTFFFKTPCPEVLSKTVTPLQHLLLGPPLKLSQRATQGGGAVLEWQAPPLNPNVRPLAPLNYQVSYRRRGQDWTKEQVLEPEFRIEAESLVPGCAYEAKVRVRVDKGHWSEWSHLVEWKIEDVLAPPILQCMFDGQAEVHCSWEVKREVAEFISYRLSYQRSQNLPAECCSPDSPGVEGSTAALLRFSCSFSVSHPEQQVQVELQPVPKAKVIPSHTNIKHAPPDRLEVKERGEDWILSWNSSEYRVPIYYELRYWIREKPEKMTYRNFTKETRTFSMHRSSLLPSTHYVAQVRTCNLPSGGYKGPLSEWTPKIEWKTHPAPWSITTLIYVFSSVLVAMIFIGCYFTLPACSRRILQWEVSVPTPIKSKVLEEIMKRNPNAKLSHQKDLDRTLICSVQVLGKVHPPSLSESCSALQVLDEDVGLGTHWDLAPDAAKQGPIGPVKDGCLSFSGPYILCSDGSQSKAPKADEDFQVGAPFIPQLPPPSLCPHHGGYVKSVSGSQVDPALDSVVGPCQERGPITDGYVADPIILMDSRPELPPGFPECDPPAYTAMSVPFLRVSGESGGQNGAYLPSGGEPEWMGWPGGQRKLIDYVTLSKTF